MRQIKIGVLLVSIDEGEGNGFLIIHNGGAQII
jgi:hypothetical protein